MLLFSHFYESQGKMVLDLPVAINSTIKRGGPGSGVQRRVSNSENRKPS